MSPVITKVSGLPSFSEKLTVVSSVFGKQLEKSHASSLSLPRNDSISLIVSSTALLRNLRCPGAGLLDGQVADFAEALAVPEEGTPTAMVPVPAANAGIPADSAAPATKLFLMNFLRVGMIICF
jgi:hypothetical protein